LGSCYLCWLSWQSFDLDYLAVKVLQIELCHCKSREVIRYFRKYFSNSQIDVYWGSAHQFMADLHTRWQEYSNG